ncbi:MAG: peptide chain release factor aRF-1 [Candidatus Nanoarchaeia archaeon]|nr:peptide chain release factor aRF-1 [Candidatus Nanoarchaeia archaeon]
MTATKAEVKELVEELEKYKGKHTEFITVYIPANYDVIGVQKQLEAEKATAKNIKSTTTRNNVIDALEKIVRELRNLRKTVNGLALFCGDISPVEGVQDLKFWVIEPPHALNTRLYRCDKEFVLDPLKQMLEVEEVFGLLVMDRKEATIGLLEGKLIQVFQKMTSGIPSQIRAGGQSSQRFHRITEGLTKEYYKRVAEEMKKIFYNMPKLKGIIIGGPVPTKDEFVEGEYLIKALKEKVIGRIDIGDTSESGLNELVEKSGEILAKQEITKEKDAVKDYFNELKESHGMATLGFPDTKKALEYGASQKVYFSTKTDKDIQRELTELATNSGAEIIIISTETVEGQQFFNLGGVGSVLRFKI